MPRAYSEAEQARIQAILLDEGRRRFTAAGLHDVLIADLCAAAGIGKGSFYLFYPSKEALFFAIQDQEAGTHRAEVMVRTTQQAGRPPVEVVADYLTMQLTRLDRHPFLRWSVVPGVTEALQRKLPAAEVARYHASDRAFSEGIARMWMAQGILPTDAQPGQLYALSAVVQALGQTRDSRGTSPEEAAATARWVIRALARQLVQPG